VNEVNEMNDSDSGKTIDINEKKFADAVKAAAHEPGAAFFEGLDESLPPVSVFTEKQEVNEMNQNDKIADRIAEPNEPREPNETNFAAATKKRRRRLAYSAVSAAACACIVFAAMFANGAGPFSAPAPRALPPLADGAVESAQWATAGKNYKDLFKLINEQASQGGFAGIGLDGGIAVQNTEAVREESAPAAAGAAPAAPAPSMETADAPDAAAGAPDGQSATAGSGYEANPQFPLDAGTDSGGINGESLAAGGNKGEGALDYSETNEQAAGVREADVLKTDGEYIYAINSNNLLIVKADKGEMELVSKIPQPAADEGQVYFEMYVAGDRLIALRHGYNTVALANAGAVSEENLPDGGLSASCIAYPVGGYITDTSVDIFDISDRQSPAKLHTLSQSGDYNNSRMIGGFLYLITTYYGGDLSMIDEGDPRTFVPLYAHDGEQFTPEESDIILPPGASWPSYTVIAGIDAAGTGGFVSQKSVYGEAGTVYVSPGAVYLVRSDWQEAKTETQSEFIKYTSMTESVLTKLTLDAGRVEPSAQARVPGSVLNQFSLDEYGGALRLVTTDDRNTWYDFENYNPMRSDADWGRLPVGESKTTNALYTLDGNLGVLGKVAELAEGERVYSCRFMGDICYFVTFRQTDPLFSVDVSDPAAPKVLGALKIPGFSEYLHPYAEGRLFGLGRDADAVTGIQQGLKLTMFDNSSPADVRELHTLVVGDEYSAAEQNHKAILIDAEKGLVAFPAYGKYLIYGYDGEKGFDKIAEVVFDGGDSAWAEIRGLFIGETFYVVGPNRINAYAIDGAFASVGSLRADEGASSVNRWSIGMPGRILPLADVPYDDAAIGYIE
jgi:uncharacterized secreted protein with C-terminal beta-propeller domain